MRVRSFAAVFALLLSSLASQSQIGPGRCRTATIEGEVKAGGQFVRRLGSGLEVMLEPLPSGWILRILPAAPSRPPHDYAELATPPYHSVSPLLISTDFSFRAQDAIGWTPRRFRYAPDAASYNRLQKAYNLYEAKPEQGSASQQVLAGLVAQAPGGTLEILDAHLIPGVADQPRAAANLATHFNTTAHVIESPPNGKPMSLGKITWIRFRITLELSKDFKSESGLKIRLSPCQAL